MRAPYFSAFIICFLIHFTFIVFVDDFSLAKRVFISDKKNEVINLKLHSAQLVKEKKEVVLDEPKDEVPKLETKKEISKKVQKKVQKKIRKFKDKKTKETIKKVVRKREQRLLPLARVEKKRKRKRDSSEAQIEFLHFLQSYLIKHKNYPALARRLGLEGLVKYKILVNKQGQFTHIQRVLSSGHELIDQASLKLLQKASGQKKLQDQLEALSIVVPIDYRLHF